MKTLSSALVLYCAFSATAEAKLYKWVDERGETHYGEVIPPEYAGQEKAQFEKGRKIKKKEAEEDTALEEKKAEEKRAAMEQRRKDQALVSTYSNESEIDLARDRNLQQVEARINSIQTLAKTAQSNLDNFRKEEEAAKKAKKPVHESLKTDIAEAEKKLEKLKQDLASAQQKEAEIRASFEADKARYRELTAPKKKR
ncbi:MAG: DUF4124 domain-containing protein [Gallionellaceae bacterium]|nr:DUF4124 domain-containing protein [Gallionellaceae bacterium]